MRSRGEREQQQRSLMARVAIDSDGMVLWCGAVQRRRRCLDKRVYRHVRQGSVKSPLALSFSIVLLLHSCAQPNTPMHRPVMQEPRACTMAKHSSKTRTATQDERPQLRTSLLCLRLLR